MEGRSTQNGDFSFQEKKKKNLRLEKSGEDISIFKGELDGCILQKRKGCPSKVLLKATNNDDLLNSAYLDSKGFIPMFTKETFFVDLNTSCKEQVK